MLTWNIYNNWYLLYKYFNKLSIKSLNTLSNNSNSSSESLNKYESLLINDDIVCFDNELYKLVNVLSQKNTSKYTSLIIYYNNIPRNDSFISLNSLSPHNNSYINTSFIDYNDYYDDHYDDSTNNDLHYDLKDDMYDIYGKSPTEFKDNIETFEYFNYSNSYFSQEASDASSDADDEYDPYDQLEDL